MSFPSLAALILVAASVRADSGSSRQLTFGRRRPAHLPLLMGTASTTGSIVSTWTQHRVLKYIRVFLVTNEECRRTNFYKIKILVFGNSIWLNEVQMNGQHNVGPKGCTFKQAHSPQIFKMTKLINDIKHAATPDKTLNLSGLHYYTVGQ